jgi:hypothetical protein
MVVVGRGLATADVLPLRSADELPFATGSSPFHMKGNAYRNAKLFHERVVPGGIAAVAAALETEALKEFYQQRFLASTWYDALPILIITGTAARLRGQDGALFLSESARQMADSDLGGVYKLLLSIASPETALARMSRVQRQYFDFGDVRLTASGDGFADTYIGGMPALMASYYRVVSTEFVHRLLTLSGARDPAATWTPFEPDGVQADMPLVKTRVHTTWTR